MTKLFPKLFRSGVWLSLFFLITLLSVMFLLARATALGPGTISLVSVNSDGEQGNNDSWWPAISANGRFVGFSSDADNLVPGDTNNVFDIFVHDLQTGATTRVSLNSTGDQANAQSQDPSLSVDGRYVSFVSEATNLVPGDTNGTSDIFVHDRQTGTTTRVSISSNGEQANNDSYGHMISANGRYVTFDSRASNLVSDDRDFYRDVFVHDRLTGATTRVSVNSKGDQGDNMSFWPTISADGRYVSFESYAGNLVPYDTNGFISLTMGNDIFVHDRLTGMTTRVSVDSAGKQGDGWSERGVISADGRYVAFVSKSGNLVLDDTNNVPDVFVHDRYTRNTTRVSTASTYAILRQAEVGSYFPDISGDGRIVAFSSYETNLVPGDDNRSPDIFVHDRQTHLTVRVSMSVNGEEANNQSQGPSLSADGRILTYYSVADNLVPKDLNYARDVFVYSYTLAPIITSFLPGFGPIGTFVTINGDDLINATDVRFNNVPTSFNIVSNSQLTATVPVGATSRKISVTTPHSTAYSPYIFAVGQFSHRIYFPILVRY